MSSLADLFDLAKHLQEESPEELVSALQGQTTATRTLITSLLHLTQQSPSKLFDNQQYLETQKATTAVNLLFYVKWSWVNEDSIGCCSPI